MISSGSRATGPASDARDPCTGRRSSARRRIRASGSRRPGARSRRGVNPISSSHSRRAAWRRRLARIERPGGQLPDPPADRVTILPDQNHLARAGLGNQHDGRAVPHDVLHAPSRPFGSRTRSRSTVKTRPSKDDPGRQSSGCALMRARLAPCLTLEAGPAPPRDPAAAAPRTSGCGHQRDARRLSRAAWRNGRSSSADRRQAAPARAAARRRTARHRRSDGRLR